MHELLRLMRTHLASGWVSILTKDDRLASGQTVAEYIDGIPTDAVVIVLSPEQAAALLSTAEIAADDEDTIEHMTTETAHYIQPAINAVKAAVAAK